MRRGRVTQRGRGGGDWWKRVLPNNLTTPLRCYRQLPTSLSGRRSRRVWPISWAALTGHHAPCHRTIDKACLPPPSSFTFQPRPSVMAFKHSKDFTVTNSFFNEIHGNATTHHHTLGEFRICLLSAMLTQLNVTIRQTSYNHQ